MRASLLRDRLAGVDCFATDMPYLTNNVTLDPTVKDLNGQPAARITYKIGKFERVSQEFFIPLLSAMCGASGAQLYAAVPQSTANSIGGTAPPTGLHTMGGMQMGAEPDDERRRREWTNAPDGQRVLRRRQRVRDLRRLQPDQHDHGRGVAHRTRADRQALPVTDPAPQRDGDADLRSR